MTSKPSSTANNTGASAPLQSGGKFKVKAAAGARPVGDDELVAELTDEATRLSGSSLRNGCPDCGVASNLASKAADHITDLQVALREVEAFIESECYFAALQAARKALGDTHEG